MYRGLVVEKKNDHVKVMTRHMGIKKVALKEGCEAGQEIYFTKEDLVQSDKRIKWNYIAAAAVFLMAIAIGGFGYMLQNAVYSVVSVDINPSVQMELNKHDKVVGITAMNDDAENIVSEELVGMQVDEVLVILVDRAETQGYFDEEKDIEGNENYNAILITTVENRGDDNDITEYLEGLIEDEYEDYNIVLAQAEKADLEAAEEEGVSVGIRMLERWRERVIGADGETGEAEAARETNRHQLSVREFFYSLEDEDLDALAEEHGAHFNQVMMKRAIELHKEAVKDAKEERDEAREDGKDEKREGQENRPDTPAVNEDKGKPDQPGKGKGLDKNNSETGGGND